MRFSFLLSSILFFLSGAFAQSQGLPNDGSIPGDGVIASERPIRIICYGWDGKCMEWSHGLVSSGGDKETRVYDKSGKVSMQFSFTEGKSEKKVVNGINTTTVDFTGTKVIP